uniref:Uncharacterized protein n=1 Tax=Panagrolaimus davidi TaxID=227884 RepID=A0A914P2Y7_9BILA
MVAINSFLRIFIYFFCNPQFRFQIITNFRYLFNKTKSVVQCEENNCTTPAASNENSSNLVAIDSPIVFEDINVQLRNHSLADETGRRSSKKSQNNRGSVTFDTSTSTKTGDTCYL